MGLVWSPKNLLVRCLIMLVLPHMILSYPVFGAKRFSRSSPVRHTAFIPVPVSVPVRHYYPDYQMSEYDDSQSNYGPYQPMYPYYGYSPLYQPERRKTDNYGYYEDDLNDPMDDLQEEMMQDKDNTAGYPYGQETWYEGTRRNENNAEANAAFLQNLIIAQMYQDAAASAAVNAGTPSKYAAAFPIVYPMPAEDERYAEDKAKQEDDQVKELQSLRKNKNGNKEKNGKKKNKNKGRKVQAEETTNNEFDRDRILNHFGNSESRYDDDKEYIFGNLKTYKRTPQLRSQDYLYQLQDELNKSKRKNYLSVGESLTIDKNQLGDLSDNLFDPYSSPQLKLVTSKPIKINGVNFSDRKNRIEVQTSTSTTAQPEISTSRPIEAQRRGQQEVVLPRPANPVRRPLADSVLQQISTRSSQKPSVYETIKHLINMEEQLRQNESKSRLQKRFVSTEGELVAELSGLKKLAV